MRDEWHKAGQRAANALRGLEEMRMPPHWRERAAEARRAQASAYREHVQRYNDDARFAHATEVEAEVVESLPAPREGA